MKKLIIIAIITLTALPLWAQGVWSVDDCMRYAVHNSPTIKKQDLYADDIKKNLTEASLAFLPSISAGTSLGGSFGRSIDPETNSYIDMSNISNSYSIGASITIFNGLSILNGFKIAKVSKLRSDLMSEQVDNNVAQRTMSAYYRAIFAYGALSISREELSESKESHKKKKIEYEIGLANISDLSQLESNVAQGEYNVINLEGAYRKSLLELKNEMFYPLEESLPVDTIGNTLPTVQKVEENLNNIFKTAKELLPDYKIVVSDQQIAKLNFSTAKASLFPTLSAGGGISTGYSKVLQGYVDAQASYSEQLKNRLGESVSIQLNIPIFNGLYRQKNIQRKRNAYDRAKIDTELKEREIERMVIEAVIDLESFEKQCNQSVVNVKSNILSYRTTSVKFEEGLSSVVDLQTTQTNLSRAKIDQLRAFLNYLMQRRVVDFYKGLPLIR